jgi:hypothetical protein
MLIWRWPSENQRWEPTMIVGALGLRSLPVFVSIRVALDEILITVRKQINTHLNVEESENDNILENIGVG